MFRMVFIGLLATIAAGAITGGAVGWYRFAPHGSSFRFSKPVAMESSELDGASSNRARSRAVVEGSDEFDFGVMSRNERRSHEFTVRNQGDAPLNIWFIDKSCQCTDVTLTRSVVPPGETTQITLTWQPSTINSDFHQTARFQTNDPGRIELDLTVRGRVLQLIQFQPSALSFDSVTAGQSREISTSFFSYQDPDVAIAQIELLDEDTAQYFETEVEGLPDEAIEAEPGAESGQLLRIRLNSAGLAMGRFRQVVRVHFNKSELGTREVHLHGIITSNITLAGPGYDSDSGIWNLGTLPGDESHSRKLFIFVKGEEAAQVEMKIVKVDPDDVLKADLVPPPAAGRFAKHVLTLHVTPQGKAVNRLGSEQGEFAEVVIETTHPTVPTLRIPVRLAIESTP